MILIQGLPTIDICCTALSVLGAGLGFANILTRAAIARLFRDYYALANGIGQSGHSIALLVFAPLTQLLLDTYGWRGATLIIGSVFAHLIVCGALMGKEGPTRSEYTPLADTDADSVRSNGEDKPSSIAKCCGGSSELVKKYQPLKALGWSVLYQPAFWITTIVYICNRLVNDLWVVYFVDHAYMKGISGPEAVIITAAAGVANLIVKVGHGPLVALGWISLRTLLASFIAVAAVCLFVDPFVDTFWPLAVAASVYMGAGGAITSLSDIYTRDLVGTERVKDAFGWMGLLSGVAICGLGFLPG